MVALEVVVQPRLLPRLREEAQSLAVLVVDAAGIIPVCQ